MPTRCVSGEHMREADERNTGQIRIAKRMTVARWRKDTRSMSSSGMLRSVALVRTDVSEEHSASIVSVTKIDVLGTMLAVTSNRRKQGRNTVTLLLLQYCNAQTMVPCIEKMKTLCYVIFTIIEHTANLGKVVWLLNRFCGLVVRVPGYRSRGPRFSSWRYQIFWEVVGLEWGPLSLVRITEELLERKSSGSGLENRE
jgi:hypothetical protein